MRRTLTSPHGPLRSPIRAKSHAITQVTRDPSRPHLPHSTLARATSHEVAEDMYDPQRLLLNEYGWGL